MLALGERAQRCQAVSQARRLLELLRRRGGLHALLEIALDRPRAAFQEHDHLVDHRAIVVVRDEVDAGSCAASDVVVEAGNTRAATRRRPLAGAVRKDLVERLERRAHRPRRRVRAEVADAAPVALAGEHDARVLVTDRDRDVGVALVVSQPDVERRLEALDVVLLEQQRLGLGRGHDRLDAHDARHELECLAIDRVLLQVREHALAQRPRLAHVEHCVVRVMEDVDPGLVGQAERLRAERVLGLRHCIGRHLCSLSVPCQGVAATVVASRP